MKLTSVEVAKCVRIQIHGRVKLESILYLPIRIQRGNQIANGFTSEIELMQIAIVYTLLAHFAFALAARVAHGYVDIATSQIDNYVI